jgi:hypothetical protein
MVQRQAAQALGKTLENPQIKHSEHIINVLTNELRTKGSNWFEIADVLTHSYGDYDQIISIDQMLSVMTSLGSADPIQKWQRPIMARALVLRALRDPAQAAFIRQTLQSEQYTQSRQPIVRFWSNKLLVMLDLADLMHQHSQTYEQRVELRKTLEVVPSVFFSPDYQWAAQRARELIDRQYPEDQTNGR